MCRNWAAAALDWLSPLMKAGDKSGQPASNQMSRAQIESVEGAPGYGQGRRGRAYAITYLGPVRALRSIHACVQKPHQKAAYGQRETEERERHGVRCCREVHGRNEEETKQT